ncbi:similar to Saccharomyces cerevisiae YGL032C AGA2 Adhesion subunit of a-agglutinin of a-cells [Maudiozyma barnettii]|uniref:Similar to Saccharomyces cerevisiae YGL032C AGA2 Adhesion subunit of a-agglutinin of a-cells n=1 Tax=Maudiozyma barnettii TaxID=61262 RepID=A0A8H2VJ85_9SACH|nr:Aga2p [Kazachstania barnettii]CAB4256751.1 similar to Saccharomyces cerevisiae YGL032C AGA2 Adhesion subunit of a-agglutinin of a-cells [Kazachstania barnettii]CAD1785405.1 similar to Saccharomyces cerevisiae YGL032C AGA2 Adhesion subunit of a-agglutinin of a-cells [Kazachstania barnettii]
MFNNCVLSILSLTAIIAPIFAQDVSVSVSCDEIPTGSLETTPYSTTVRNVVHNGVTEQMLFEYYKSVTYVEDCNPTSLTTTASASATTITIF